MSKPDSEHTVAACAIHEPAVRQAREMIEKGLYEETWTLLEESLNCHDCQIVVATMTGDPSFLDPEMSYPRTTKAPLRPPSALRLAPKGAITPNNDSATPAREECAAEVHDVRVWPDRTSSPRTGPRRIMLQDRPYPTLELVGMFDPTYSTNSAPQTSCLTVLWNFKKGLDFYSDSLQVDEIVIYLLQGEIEWKFEGGTPARYRASAGGSHLIWAGANPEGISGIPPFTVNADKGTPAIAVAQFYSWRGVQYTADRDGVIKITGSRWTAQEIDAYWQSIERYVHQMPGGSPFSTRIPSTRADLASFIETNKLPERRDFHRNARVAGQLIDADVPGWPMENHNHAKYFNEYQSLSRPGQRKHPMLDLRLLSFPGKFSSMDVGQIEGAHHPGYETIVPLAGRVRCGWVRIAPGQADCPPALLGDFGSPQASHASAPAYQDLFPQILLLRSEIAHGFTAGDPSDAYALHVRCHDYHQHRSYDDLNGETVTSPHSATRKISGGSR